MTDQKNLDKTIEQVFKNGNEALPEDKYFTQIWNSIENRAPVGEKYYLRSFFSIFFFFLIVVLFTLFYTEFLSTVLTLKNIRQENSALFSTAIAPPLHPFYTLEGKEYKRVKMAGGIVLDTMEKSLLQVKKETTDSIQWDFYSGHVVVEKNDASTMLQIFLPDMTLFLRQGRFNLFCYDNIIRLIPLSHPVEVEVNHERLSIKPGKTFYLLNKKVVSY